MAPHSHLYTRLRVSPGRGIGVFAIRDIPAGTNPFAGDVASTVRFPMSDVDMIEEPEVRKIYLDFCPVHEGDFIAPADLNLLTTSWYMNHSDQPNIAADADINFLASRLILKGEELTVDYTRFSDGAKRRLVGPTMS